MGLRPEVFVSAPAVNPVGRERLAQCGSAAVNKVMPTMIASSAAQPLVLLFAQETPDSSLVGLEHNQNCVSFTRESFASRLEEYLANPADPKWLKIREAGRELIRQRHTISLRLNQLEEHVTKQRQ
jgi:hypothetical protein